MAKSPNAIDLMAKLFKPAAPTTAADRARSELAAATKARDDNMERLKQLRLQRDAIVLQSAKPAPAKSRNFALQRKPAKFGRA
jgi:hypothetical protein